MPALTPMKQGLQVFVLRSALRSGPRSAYRNFLIIDPESTGSATAAAPDEQVAALARQLSQDGYAYVACSGQKQMEDDPSGVRYLPLSRPLPFFALMTAVIVMADPAWAALAAVAYPEADIFLMQTS